MTPTRTPAKSGAGAQLLRDLRDGVKRRPRRRDGIRELERQLPVDDGVLLVREQVLGVGPLAHVALLDRVAVDPRAHHVGAPARRDLLADARPRRARSTRRCSAGTTCVATSARPAGLSASVDVSRSPKTVIATVRGIGVAVMTSRCGASLPPRPQGVPLLDAEPVLLVHHDEPEVRELDASRSSSAWVPTTIPAAPDAASASAWRRSHRALRAGEQRDARRVRRRRQHAALREGAQEVPQRANVLGREHLRGREERRLPSGVDHAQHRA